MFQCPTSGSSHFYKRQDEGFAKLNEMFQCPTSGSSHFYRNNVESFLLMLTRFNALHRAHPISTYLDLSEKIFYGLFQCPTSGSSHFYLILGSKPVINKKFQCPTSGSSHFYGIPRQPPIESAFPSLILGGNSQNILKTMIFHLKNGMFTICSYFHQ